MSDEFQYADPQAAYAQPTGSQSSTSTPHRRLAEAIDPRKAIDPTAVERMIRAQVAARTQAQAATTVVLATIVSLITSAFSFVAALAWNTAIQQILNELFGLDGKNKNRIFGITLTPGQVEAIYAVIVTIIAVVVVVILNRMAKRMANKSALGSN